jgi:hypothetical protein
MRRLPQALVALLLAWGVRGESDGKSCTFISVYLANLCIDSDQYQGGLQHNAQLNTVREVVVWVDQNGDRISVETNHHAAETLAAAQQGKVGRGWKFFSE